MKLPKNIKGGQYKDHRGILTFVNDFDMTLVKRFYCLEHPDVTIIRGWQGHKIEQKWFYCIKGSFKINLAQIEDLESEQPTKLKVSCFQLNSDEPKVLHVPGGYASGIKAIEVGSKLMVYSDCNVEDSQGDDFRFPILDDSIF